MMKTGISFMKLVKKLDEGPICEKFKVKISKNDNYESLSDKLSSLASEKILDIIDDIFDQKVLYKEQNHKDASYANKIIKSEGEIIWSEDAEKILGKINGLNPYPGAWFIFKGERYKILEAELGFKSDQVGKVLDNNLEIACGNKKSIKVIKIQEREKIFKILIEFMQGTSIKKLLILIMHRYQLKIEYVGSKYLGWQIQKKVKQSKTLQKVLKKIFNKNIQIFGSGRTDTGVHALEQSAHFDIEKKNTKFE